MKHILLILFILGAAHYSNGQTYTVKGSVTDTLNMAPLPRASVVLIRAKDSIIETYTRTKANGTFELQTKAMGKYIVRITFPSFGDYVDEVNIDKTTTDIGEIPMVSRENLLKEFVLTKQIAAIKVKGDTTEYMADSFKVKENANVEDLLKKLPGISVDKNGKISAQGETVQKILVDGEEFFADDPKVVTQGLQANAVEKVQVYDKKSEQAEFTGIDDGQKTKTINLQLKENRKRGYFGKLDLGAANAGYFQEQAMINAFRGKRQLSAFGIASNTDKVGLGWQDNGKFGSGNEMSEDGGITFFSDNDDQDISGWNGKFNGQGLPKVWTGGLHYADKWNEDKSHLNGNYRYARQQVEIDGDVITQWALEGDSTNVSSQHKNQFSKAERHGLDASYEWKIDTNNTIKVTLNGGLKNGEIFSQYNTHTDLKTSTDSRVLYNNNRTITSTNNGDFVNAYLLYKKKFAKKGRTLSLDIKENNKESESDGRLLSTITPNTPVPIDSVINQKKINNSGTLAFSAKATYTEPLSKVTSLEFNYSSAVNNSTSQNYSYNSSSPGQFDLLDSGYSSYFKYNVLTNSGGLSFRYVNKKINFSLGSNLSNAAYVQTDHLHGDTSRSYNFTNVFPTANFKYRVSNQSSFNFNYYGSTKQPTINQIQPLLQNTDPTNITIGNPALKQEFTHKLSFTVNNYKILTHQWLWINGSFDFTNDAISTSQVNKDGINRTQYVNVDGNYHGWMWAGGGFQVAKTDLNIQIHVNPGINHQNNFINGQKNVSDYNNYAVGMEFNYAKEKKYDFSFSPEVTYNDNRSTVSAYSVNYWSGVFDFSAEVQLPKKFEVHSDVKYYLRQQTTVFQGNNNVIKWNAYVGKKLLKNGELEIRMSVFDILNQNIGFERNASGSIITQNSYNTIRRYGMLSAVWNFTHKPSGDAETK